MAKNNYFTNLPVIGGVAIAGEIDESKFGRWKFKGNRVNGVWVPELVYKNTWKKIIIVFFDQKKKFGNKSFGTIGERPFDTQGR